MNISIDSKIQKLCKRPLDSIPDTHQISHCINEIVRHLNQERDCLLVTSPASLKTRILFAIACINTGPQETRIVLPVDRPYLSFAYALSHICIQSYDTYLNDTNKQCTALLVDEGELIDNPIDGERLESLLIESDSAFPLVLAINSRSNIDEIARWVTHMRKRKCMVIQAQYPKTIIPTYLTHTGEWLPLLDRKKLNRKVKNHLKTIKSPISLKEIYFQCIDLISTQQLFPAIFVLPDISTAINLWQKNKDKESTLGQYMTAPQIVRIMDNHPGLKDNPFVIKMLKKRAGLCFNDQIWMQLLENFFSLNAFDIIFTTIETINQLYCTGKSLILMAHPAHDSKNTDISQALWFDQLLMRSGYYANFMDEIQKQQVFFIVTDSPEVSPVHVKDYLDTGVFSLKSHFKWNLQNVQGRIVRHRSPLEDLQQSFLVASQGARNNVLFHDAIMEIQAEFPHARCLPVNAMSFLNSIRIKWTNELAENRKQVKYSSGKNLETKYQTTKFLLNCIPCNDCVHESICHHRGSKRFRELMDTFYTFQTDRANEHLLLETTVPCYYDLLQQLDWINDDHEITPKGQMAHQLRMMSNPLLTECLFNNLIPKDNHRLGAAILAGFLPGDWSFPSHIDLRYPSISAVYQKFWPHLRETSTKMLALGIYPHIPDYQLSCIYYSLTSSDEKLTFIEQTNLNEMIVNLFIDQVNDWLFALNC